MQVTRVSPKRQITIPKEIYDKLHLEAGDFLEVDIKEEGIVLIPKKLISRDQEWFWTKEWQEKEREADAAIAKGAVSKVLTVPVPLSKTYEKRNESSNRQAIQYGLSEITEFDKRQGR